ncbi:zinc finger C2HC domain-containing protein 1A isoform X1 [Periophthalmus magnuspinnatus]|uniref:zinc finger C2HC domain-containing protein 1A isoform X1 n=1 Tax=Periophthalmus magnuspinnatus TaxID=409849 RepID=UPI00145A7CB0|nr:zinc finger C2HC domain-containing protein 1A isoform X1 [Periophthalmus magnuspinnatus]
MEEFEDEAVLPPQDLVQCHICNRSFFPKVLDKHVKICQKAAAKRRKVFDSSRQRAEGTDIPTLKPLKPKSQSSSSSVKAEPPKKPSNWRKKHEDFIAAIRAARNVSQGTKDGEPLPPPPPPSYDPDYIQCPHCQRRFNENAADRHIKFCQEQAARMGNKTKAEVKKPPARTQYKPPGVKKSAPPPASTIPSASSRLPQRAGSGQATGTPGKASSAGTVRNNPSSLTSPPSNVGMKPRVASSGYSSVRNASGAGVNKKKADPYISRNEVDGDIGNGGVKSKFCHECGAKYPVESAKFCCECGVRRMCISSESCTYPGVRDGNALAHLINKTNLG